MGYFDYTCECGGTRCDHVGGQLSDATVIIEVPISDGTNVYLKGQYEQNGYVVVAGYKFYLKEFEDYFNDWVNEIYDSFVASKVWTYHEHVYVTDKFGDQINGWVRRSCFDDVDGSTEVLTDRILQKCIKVF